MGIKQLFPYLKKKGYEPDIRHTLPLASTATDPPQPPICRVDVLGTYFLTIRYAYIRHPPHTAQQIVEKEISKLGDKSRLILYVDGHQAMEKQATHDAREATRAEAKAEAQKLLSELEDRVKKDLSVRKWRFDNIDKSIKKSFYWNVHDRASFCRHMEQSGWTVRTAATEADVAIARDIEPGDVVISRDSDMLIYGRICTLYRPISRGRFLVYDIQEVAASLDLTRAQLTMLGVVSHNGYNRNISSLGTATNHKIMKELSDAEPEKMVQSYLSHNQVALKNTTKESFALSMRDFVHLKQEPVQPMMQVLPEIRYQDLMLKLQEIRDQHFQQKSMREEQHRRLSASASTTKSIQQNSPKGYNRYRTVDRCPPNYPKRNSWHPRYTHKTRVRILEHEPPKAMVRYKWKPYTTRPRNPADNEASTNDRSGEEDASGGSANSASTGKPLESMEKVDLMRAMKREHPLSTLNVGTLSANVRGAVENTPRDLKLYKISQFDSEFKRLEVAAEVERCLRDVSRIAHETKRKCQQLVGCLIECIGSQDTIETGDRKILDFLCPRISATSTQKTTEDPDDGQGGHGQFFTTLATYLYSGSCMFSSMAGKKVVTLINRAHDFGLCERVRKDTIRRAMPYPASSFLDGVGSSMAREYKQHYCRGTADILEKASKKKLVPDVSLQVNNNLSAIENFHQINRANRSRYKSAPMSGVTTGFITLSELDLVRLFWQHELLRKTLLEITKIEFHAASSQQDVCDWISCKEPGYLIRRFISHVGKDEIDPTQIPRLKTKAERIRLKSHKGSIRLLSIEDIRQHIGRVRDTSRIREYTERGYVAHGSIRTDGLRIQVLAYKLKELQCARYKRVSEDLLPPRITTTVAGVDHFLTEVRNVVRTSQDVADIWQCDPTNIKILGLDFGQSFVVGACALLPSDEGTGEFHNLTINSKAVYQPTVKLRRWTESRKHQVPPGREESLAAIETRLPPVRGPDANMAKYVEVLTQNEGQLQEFYNGGRMIVKRNVSDARKAREAEFAIMTDRILNMVGGSIGRRRSDDDKVLIGVGLGQFSSQPGLTSLHTSFMAYFVQKARALGYVVVGTNEYYTSRKCPVCHNFLCQVNIRRLYCPVCKVFMHRDTVGGQNIANVLRGHLMDQARPRYLQPVDRDGGYLWEQSH